MSMPRPVALDPSLNVFGEPLEDCILQNREELIENLGISERFGERQLEFTGQFVGTHWKTSQP